MTVFLGIAAALGCLVSIWAVVTGKGLRKQFDQHVIDTNSEIKALRKEISQIYLTEEDRKDLGLPARSVQVVEKQPETGKPWEIQACSGSHKWSATWNGKPNLPSNMNIGYTADRGIVPLRRCLKCTKQQAKSRASGWFDD